jgi:plasmid stability protein
MPDVLVRDVEQAVLDRLKKRAAENGRSLQSEVRFVINEYVKGAPIPDSKVAKKIKDALRGKPHTDSAVLLRDDRTR